jgi:hypothetical protein
MEPLADKIKRNADLKNLFIQSWMLLLGLFWFARFLGLKSEAMWLITLDTYRGDETESLVRVSLAKDGMMFLAGALILLVPYFIKVVECLIKRKKSNKSSDPT